MIETHEQGRELAGFDLVADVAGAEHRRGEANQCVENDEQYIHLIDDEVATGSTVNEKQRHSREEGRKHGNHVTHR